MSSSDSDSDMEGVVTGIRTMPAAAKKPAASPGPSPKPKAPSAIAGGPHVRQMVNYLMVGVRLVAQLDRLAWGYLIVEM